MGLGLPNPRNTDVFTEELYWEMGSRCSGPISQGDRLSCAPPRQGMGVLGRVYRV